MGIEERFANCLTSGVYRVGVIDKAYVDIRPEIFEMEEDVAIARLEEIPEAPRGKCREAAEACPVDTSVAEEWKALRMRGIGKRLMRVMLP